MSYAEKLEEFCKQSGYKKTYLASRIGISAPYLWRLCNEKNLYPSTPVAAQIQVVTGGFITQEEIEREKEAYLNEKFQSKIDSMGMNRPNQKN